MALREDYDPVKAREYYLRNRKLKGKKPGASRPSSTRPSGGNTATAMRPKAAVKPKSNTKAASEARVAAMKVRLQHLESLLKTLLKQAKARSGVDPASTAKKDPASDGSKAAGDSKPTTAAEKAKAAKRSKEAYDKSHPEEALTKDIEAVQKRIAKVREDMANSIQTARGKAAVQLVSRSPKG